MSALDAEFTEEARQRRLRAWGRIAADPTVALPMVAMWKGPHSLPAHAFGQAAWDRLLS